MRMLHLHYTLNAKLMLHINHYYQASCLPSHFHQNSWFVITEVNDQALLLFIRLTSLWEYTTSTMTTTKTEKSLLWHLGHVIRIRGMQRGSNLPNVSVSRLPSRTQFCLILWVSALLGFPWLRLCLRLLISASIPPSHRQAEASWNDIHKRHSPVHHHHVLP